MTNVVKCVGAEQGCLEVFRTEDAVAPGARFSCKVHTGKDTANSRLAFQTRVFDKELGKGTDPKAFTSGIFVSSREKKAASEKVGPIKKERLINNAKKLLEDGEYDEKTKKEILDIVESDLRDHQ